jgi:hypothetical protein
MIGQADHPSRGAGAAAAAPEGPQLGRDGAPLGAVPVPPNDRLDRAAQIVVLGLAPRAARLDQRRQHRPLLIRQNRHATFPSAVRRQIGADLKR